MVSIRRAWAAAAIAISGVLGGCAQEQAPPPRNAPGNFSAYDPQGRGSAPWGAPQGSAPYGGAPYASPQAPAPTAPQPGAWLAPAVTAFGILLQQLPTIPQQLPPLPPIHDWSTLPWPFPWGAPAPGAPAPGGPAPVPGADGWRADWAAFEDEVLRLTNERRATGAVCGGQAMGPAAPVSVHGALRASARGHSRDMSTRGYFDHTSPEGRGPSHRANAAGYQGTFVGENIAAGQPDPARVVQAWMESPGHCVNIMDPRYRVLGVGYYQSEGDRFRHYWTQNFGG